MDVKQYSKMKKVVASNMEIDSGKQNAPASATALPDQSIKVVASALEIDTAKDKPSASSPTLPHPSKQFSFTVSLKKVVASALEIDTGKDNASASSPPLPHPSKQVPTSNMEIDFAKQNASQTMPALTAPTNEIFAAATTDKTVVTPDAFARPHDPVKNITKKREIWSLFVRIDDMWSVYKGDTEDHIELLLRDTNGDIIQATILGDDIPKWKQQLAEGKDYWMRNFRVAQNDFAYKFASHKFRLTFVGATKADPIEISGMPPNAFQFKDFAEILSGKFEPDLLVDVIGVVNSVGKTFTASATRKGNVSFTLKDVKDNVIDCTLWDSLSVDFLTGYNEQCDAGPVVMIIKHARVKEPQGNYPLQLTNVWNGTKLLFDTNVQEIANLIARFPKNTSYSSQSIGLSNSTQFSTQSYGGSQYTSDENFMSKARIISLGEMKKLKVDTYCVTVVTTDKIKVTPRGWYFRACHDCSCKAEGEVPPFVCKKGHQTNDPLIKYHLDVLVKSRDHDAKFVFWDNTLDVLLGMTAATLQAKMQQIGLGHPTDYPKMLDDLMDRQLAFRVKWTPGWGGQASVLQCQDNPDLVAKILEHFPAAESSVTTQPNVDPDIAEDLPSIDSSENQVFTQTDIDKFACLDDSILSTPNLSASAENSMSASSHKTPGKRSAGKSQQVDQLNLDIQFSSTRSGKIIKKEKN